MSQYNIPEHTLAALRRYVDERIAPGGFLMAVLSNDLVGAFSRADSENLAALPDIVRYVYWEIPQAAWGSEQAVWDYMKDKFYERINGAL